MPAFKFAKVGTGSWTQRSSEVIVPSEQLFSSPGRIMTGSTSDTWPWTWSIPRPRNGIGKRRTPSRGRTFCPTDALGDLHMSPVWRENKTNKPSSQAKITIFLFWQIPKVLGVFSSRKPTAMRCGSSATVLPGKSRLMLPTSTTWNWRRAWSHQWLGKVRSEKWKPHTKNTWLFLLFQRSVWEQAMPSYWNFTKLKAQKNLAFSWYYTIRANLSLKWENSVRVIGASWSRRSFSFSFTTPESEPRKETKTQIRIVSCIPTRTFIPILWKKLSDLHFPRRDHPSCLPFELSISLCGFPVEPDVSLHSDD